MNLPNEKEREQIFRIHIGKKHAQDIPDIDLKSLVTKTKGYCGADIESVVHDGLEIAFLAEKDRISTEDIMEAIKAHDQDKAYYLSKIHLDYFENYYSGDMDK